MPVDLTSCLKVIVPYGAICAMVHILSFSGVAGRLKDFKTKDKVALANRVVSTMHAIIMFSMTANYWFFVNPKMDMGAFVDDYQAFCLNVMLGYLLYDTLFELTAGKQVMTLGHHVMGAASHISVLYSNHGAIGFYSMLVFIAEGSTPLLNASWLLQKLNMLNTSLFKLCALSLLVSFFVLRILLSPYMLWHMWTYRPTWGPNTDQLFWFNFLIVALFGVLNYFWFYKLVQVSMKKK